MVRSLPPEPICSKQIGHVFDSSPDTSSDPGVCLCLPLLGLSLGVVAPRRRSIPSTLTEADRQSFIVIAQRSQIENANMYSILCHGLDFFHTLYRLKQA